ncbi:MAG: lactate racemase domain-containing protein, partial [Bacillota bacterium]|nr:lactate racemase domain-containing protein [Bacillota bacterium]
MLDGGLTHEKPGTRVHVPLGKGSIEAVVPNLLTVMRPESVAGVPDPYSCVKAALANPVGSKPLVEVARRRRDAVIVVNDITRPYPGGLLVSSIAEELARAGIGDDRITLVVAYGNHRRNTPPQLRSMFGDEVIRRFRIVHHDGADESSLKHIGDTPGGVPLYINRVVAEAGLKIITGLVTPHHSAGFSGGRKSILPGVAGLRTLNVHHSLPIRPYEPAMGWYGGNAFHEEALVAARMVGVDFMVNTIDNADREL